MSPSTVDSTACRVDLAGGGDVGRCRPSGRRRGRGAGTRPASGPCPRRRARRGGRRRTERAARGRAPAPTPKKPSIVLRLWVPVTHRCVARNWNARRFGLRPDGVEVANRVAVSTPLRTAGSVMVMVDCSLVGWLDSGRRRRVGAGGRVRSAAPGVQATAATGRAVGTWAPRSGRRDHHGGQRGRSARKRARLDARRPSCWATNSSTGGKPVRRRWRRRVGQVVAEVAGTGVGLGLGQVAVKTPWRAPGQQLGVAEGVGDAVAGDRVPVVAGVADQGPARSRMSGGCGWAGRWLPAPATCARRAASARPGRGWRSRRSGRTPAARAPAALARVGGRGAGPDVGLAVVGREDAGHDPVGDVELEAVPGIAREVGVVGGAEGTRSSISGAPTARAIARAEAVGADHEPGAEAPVAAGRGRG